MLGDVKKIRTQFYCRYSNFRATVADGPSRHTKKLNFPKKHQKKF